MTNIPILRVSVVFLVIETLQLSSQNENYVTRETGVGNVKGIRKSVLGKDVDVFLGIPFAQPPIGELRFQNPQPLKNLAGSTVDATKLPNSCMQEMDPFGEDTKPNTPLSEDCLYLNIWQPVNDLNPTHIHGKAVMIWIYGGGFITGTSTVTLYDGAAVASEGDVIVVSLNYRLGPLGFLYLGNKMAPGNMGLLDQNLAIQWVHDNIQAFGGDRDRVTIFGESAGAGSISFHILSAKSNNLFRSAIMQSGAPTREWAYVLPSEAKSRTQDLAGVVGCDITSDEEILKCLKGVNASTLTAGQFRVKPGKFVISAFVPFNPTIDGEFLKYYPSKYEEEGNFKQKSVMQGYTRDEGTLMVAANLLLKERLIKDLSATPTVDKNLFDKLTKEILIVNASDAIERVAQVYGTPVNSGDYLQVSSDMAGDVAFKCPTERFAAALSKKMPVYAFLFEQRNSVSQRAKWMGVVHGEDIYYVFGVPLVKPGYSEEEKELSKVVIQYWTNFAKTGNPNKNENGSTTTNTWPAFTESEKNLMLLNSTQLKSDKNSAREKYCKVLRENRQNFDLEDESSANRQPFWTPLLIISAVTIIFMKWQFF